MIHKFPDQSFQKTYRSLREAIEQIPPLHRTDKKVREILEKKLAKYSVAQRKKLIAEAFSDPNTWMKSFSEKTKSILMQLTIVRPAFDLPMAPKSTNIGMGWRILNRGLMPLGGDLLDPILAPKTGYQLRFLPSLALGVGGAIVMMQTPTVGPILTWLYEIHPLALMAMMLQNQVLDGLVHTVQEENEKNLIEAREASCMAKNYELWWQGRFPLAQPDETENNFLKRLKKVEKDELVKVSLPGNECTWIGADVSALSEREKEEISKKLYQARPILADLANEIITTSAENRKNKIPEIVQKNINKINQNMDTQEFIRGVKQYVSLLTVEPWELIEFSKLYFSLQTEMAKQLCPKGTQTNVRKKLQEYFAQRPPQCDDTKRDQNNCQLRFDLRIPFESKKSIFFEDVTLEANEQLLKPLEKFNGAFDETQAERIFSFSWQRSFWEAGYCEQFFRSFANEKLDHALAFEVSRDFFLESNAVYKIDENYFNSVPSTLKKEQRIELIRKGLVNFNLVFMWNDSQLKEVLEDFTSDDPVPPKRGILGRILQTWLLENSCGKLNMISVKKDKRKIFNALRSAEDIYQKDFKAEFILNPDVKMCE
jgi:hypothetical protein